MRFRRPKLLQLVYCSTGAHVRSGRSIKWQGTQRTARCRGCGTRMSYDGDKWIVDASEGDKQV